MNYNFKPVKPGMMTIIAGLFLFLVSTNTTFSQLSSGLSREELNLELRKAIIQKNETGAIELIKGNRLLIKPFVDGLIRETIALELAGKKRESVQSRQIVEKVSAYFQDVFGEKSLSIAVNYLTLWSITEKKQKLSADSLYAAGTEFRLNNEKEQALGCFWAALEKYNMIKDERGEAEVLGGLGALYFNNYSSRQEALDFYQAALKKREKVDDRQLTGNTLNSLGAVYVSFLNDYPTALKFYERAEGVRSEIGDNAGLRTVRMNMADACRQFGDQLNMTGNFNESLEFLNRAYEIFLSINEKVQAAIASSTIGYVYTKLGDYNTAAERLTEALGVMKEENDTIGLAGVYNNFGILLQRAGRTEKASEYYNNALTLYEKMVQLRI